MYLLLGDGTLFDYDHQLLKGLTELLDRQIASTNEQCKQVDDPDGRGLFDSLEYLCGIGLVACQGYLTATYPSTKQKRDKVLRVPPKCGSGGFVADLVLAGANYWKHEPEWSVESGPRPGTVMTLKASGLKFDEDDQQVDIDYVCREIVFRLGGGVSPSSTISDLLAEWRNEVSSRWPPRTA